MHVRPRIVPNFTSPISWCWFDHRKLPRQYNAIDPVRRLRPGKDNKQRPQSQEVQEQIPYQEDHPYHAARIGRIQTELVIIFKGSTPPRSGGGFDARLPMGGDEFLVTYT